MKLLPSHKQKFLLRSLIKIQYCGVIVVVVSYCFASLFDTNGHLSDIVIWYKTVQSFDEMNDVQMMTSGWGW